MKLFIREHASFIVVYVFQFAMLMATFQWINHQMVERNKVYLFLLSLFLLLLFLLYRLVINWSLYSLLSKKSRGEPKSFLQISVKSAFLQAIQTLFSEQYRLLQNRFNQTKQEQTEHLHFITHWVHQLKTPMSVIQMILQDGDEVEYADIILDEFDRMNYSLNMIIDLSRVSSFHNDFRVEKINLKKLVYETINEMKQLFIRNRIFPDVQIEDETMVYSDRKWIKFTLFQLLSNAIRYSKGKNKQVVVHIYQNEKKIYLSVKDQGAGITPQDLPRIFDLYFTGENGRKFKESSGIGLYLVKKICDQLQHQIDVRSTEMEGSEFIIIFDQIVT